MGIIKNIEDFKKIELFRAIANKWYIEKSDESYIALHIQPFDFKDAEFNDESYLEIEWGDDDIFGKTNEEFLDWLMEKSREEGYPIAEILEDEFSVQQDTYILERIVDETKNELMSDTTKLWENESKYVDGDELEYDLPYFTSFEDAKRFLVMRYPEGFTDDGISLELD